MKKEVMEFVLAILDKMFKFFGKMKCACCVSTCIVDKSVNCPENNILDNNNDETNSEKDKEK
tara:strand:- start:179 stop:364 length:186 start_codon:yes stop_codon:yes gene_type:complete